jgi:DNA-binding response OmpR family regulator
MDTSPSVPVVHVLIGNPLAHLRHGLCYVARLLGCAVTEASTHDEVLTQLDNTPDIVVVDAALGALDVCRQIKGDAVCRHLLILVTTFLPTPEDAAPFLAAGAAACIERPIDMAVFRCALEQAVQTVICQRQHG